jgi:uncharacterized membrane protein
MYKNIIVLIVLLLAVDSIWLFLINKKYSKMVKDIQNDKMELNYYSAIIVYLLIAIGLYYLIIRGTNKDQIKKAIIFGLVSYGIYDFTNGAIFKKWDFKLAIGDTIWGGILCGLTVFFYNKIFNKIQ